MREIRLIDLGAVPALRSHAVYHALGSEVGRDAPDTLVLSIPTEHYISLGTYQVCARQIDVEYCRERNIQVLRRQIGGGAHVLGPNRLLFQTVFRAQRSAMSATRMYQEILGVAVDTYRSLGVDAHYMPFTDILVREARISAGALGRIAQSVILASSLAYEDDPELARRALQPHAHVAATSMCRELGSPPDRDVVTRKLLENFERNLAARIRPGSLTGEERAQVERTEEVLSSSEWLRLVSDRIRSLKETGETERAVRVVEGHHLTADDITIRATVRVVGDAIGDVAFTGDFLFYRDHLDELERSFRNAGTEWDALMTVAENFYLLHEVDSPGVTPADWVNALNNAITGPSAP